MNHRLEKADSAEEEDLGLPPVEVDPRILEAASRNFVSNPDQPSSSEQEISLNQPPPPSIPSRGPATPQVSASSSVPTVAEASIEDPNSLNANNNQNGGGDAIPIVHAMAVMDPDPNNNYGGSMNAQHQQEASQQVIVEPSPLESSIAVPAGAAAAPAQPSHHPYAQQESPLPPLMIQQTPPPQQQQDVRKSGCVIFSLTSALVCMCCLLPIICIVIFVGLDWEDVSFDDDDQYATDDFFNTNFFDEDSTD